MLELNRLFPPLCLCQLSRNNVLSWEFSSTEESHIRSLGLLKNCWHHSIGQETGHDKGGVGWHVVMVKFAIVCDKPPPPWPLTCSFWASWGEGTTRCATRHIACLFQGHIQTPETHTLWWHCPKSAFHTNPSLNLAPFLVVWAPWHFGYSAIKKHLLADYDSIIFKMVTCTIFLLSMP